MSDSVMTFWVEPKKMSNDGFYFVHDREYNANATIQIRILTVGVSILQFCVLIVQPMAIWTVLSRRQITTSGG